jgi:YesN/AraC family two-component response regulator
MSVHQSFQIVGQPLPPVRVKAVRPFRPLVIKESEPSGSPMSLKTLIVDDEPIARKVLGEELELIEDVEVVGEADNGSSALEKIAKHQPGLVLLDLQMPVMGGLDVVRSLKHGTHLPVIVIVTAYDRFALQAFEAGAIDYLLKPVSHDRLVEAVERAKRITSKEAIDKLAHLQEIAEPAASTRTKRIVG